MKVNWEKRLRDGFFYAMGSGVTLLLLSFFYQIHTIHSQVFCVVLLFPWWFLTVQAIRRLFPGFFGDLEYTVYRIKEEDKQKEMLDLGDAVAKQVTPEQTPSKRQPTSEEFWTAQKAGPAGESAGTKASMSLPRIMPVSYPKRIKDADCADGGEADTRA